MNASKVKTLTSTSKFQNSEQLWFWFLYSRASRSNFSGRNFSPSKRACELLDVETLITQLYLSGELTDEQLAVMKEFGDKRRSPHQHIWSENKKAACWRDAMQTLHHAAQKKGWIE